MSLTPEQIDRLVDEVVARVRNETAIARAPAFVRGPGRGMHDDLDRAVACAQRAFEAWRETRLEVRARCIAAIRSACLARVEEIARFAAEETGLGRAADKVVKNRVAIEKTPGMEILEPLVFTGDHGLTLHERAPFGVLLAITPSTNPTETVINNALSMIAAGNAVVFNVHPAAKGCCAMVIGLIAEALRANGGPEDLVSGIALKMLSRM